MKATHLICGNELKNAVGSRVWFFRKRKKPALSLPRLSRDLAKRGVKIGRFALMKLERGERHVLDYEVLALSQALDVSVADLYGTWGDGDFK